MSIRFNPKAIERLKRKHGLSYRGFGAMIGVSDATIRDWINGGNPTAANLAAIVNTFHIRLDRLFIGRRPIRKGK